MTKTELRPWSLPEHAGQSTPLQRLQATVRNLTRAKRRQTIIEHIWTGLFCGLIIACVAVLALRLNWLPLLPTSYPMSIIIIGIVASTLLIAVIVAWQRCPSDLQVAIQADMQLNLKQKLSTAWEFARLTTDPVLNDQLALQAVQSRLPARAEHVFPLRINTWGKLIPVAIGLLLLLAIIDLQPNYDPTTPTLDPVVVEQGVQLREYARQMQARAQRENLPRSTEQSRNMQRLGNRMESGQLAREQALQRLRQLATDLEQQRRAALSASGDSEIRIDPERLETTSQPSLTNTTTLQTTLEKITQGSMRSNQIQFSDDEKTALARHGISLQDLAQALENLDAGDDEELRKILETLKNSQQQNIRDAEELDQARRKLQQVRENLGDSETSSNSESNPGDDSLVGDDGWNEGDFGTHSDGMFAEDNDTPGPNRGAGYGQQPGQQQDALLQTPNNDASVVLKPQSQPREGEVFTSEVQILPRAGQATLDLLELADEYTTQVEAALSKEDYPLHHKELIRRYFLSLSEGTNDTDTAIPAPAQ